MIPANVVHPDQVLEALIEKGNRRDKNEKLKKLHQLCAQEYRQHSQGARDLGLANISRLAESHGLFKARTIYNKQSEDYAALITAWAGYSGPKTVPSRESNDHPVPEKYGFLKKIEDPAVRSLCHMGLIQRDKLKAQLDLLKSQTKLAVDMRPIGAEIAKGAKNVAILETAARLTDSERSALEAAVAPEFIKGRKWTVGDDGEVVAENGRFVFQPGFVTAIKRILGNFVK